MIFEELFESIAELESAITAAKAAVSKTVPPKQEVLERLESYEKILEQQRALAATLCNHAMRRNWGEVSRHIRIIKALSQMIRDDAIEVVTGVEPRPKPAPAPERLLQ